MRPEVKGREYVELEKLGEEYLRRHEILRERIRELRAALSGLDGPERAAMDRRVLSLYVDAADCRRTAEYLLHYREKEEPDASGNALERSC